MKFENPKRRSLLLKENGDFKWWVVIAFYLCLIGIGLWLAVELISGYLEFLE